MGLHSILILGGTTMPPPPPLTHTSQNTCTESNAKIEQTFKKVFSWPSIKTRRKSNLILFKSAWIESGSRVEDGGDFYLKTSEWVLIRRKKVSMKEWNYCPGKFYWSFVAISLNCRQI